MNNHDSDFKDRVVSKSAIVQHTFHNILALYAVE